MKTPLAWFNLIHQKTRTLVAVAGVAFAIVLIFMQLGFLGAVLNTANLVYDQLEFDILATSPEYLYLLRAGEFPRERLFQVQGHPGISSAAPLYVGSNRWSFVGPSVHKWSLFKPSSPEPETVSHRRHILVIGFRLNDRIFTPGLQKLIDRNRGKLTEPGNVLMDSLSRWEFGDWRKTMGPSFGSSLADTDPEIGGHRIHIVGEFAMGAGFAGDGTVIATDTTYARFFGGNALDRPTLGLITVKPGYRPQQVVKDLEALHLKDVMVRTRAEVLADEKSYWLRQTNVGAIFTLGVIIALTVGIVFVYQVMASDIANHLGEYATLKAMGYQPRALASVVMQQALLLAVFGYVPALAVSMGLYALTTELAGLEVTMDLTRALFVLVLAIGMCAISGLLSLQKVQAADPADLF